MVPSLVGVGGRKWVRACGLHWGFSSFADPAPTNFVALDVALALGICRVKWFRFMMENGPRDWGDLLLTNRFQLVH